MKHRSRIILVAICALALVASSATPSSASTATVSGLRSISGASPFPAACDPPAQVYGRYEMEGEPSIAVNPKDPDNMVTAWIQDWADGIVVASTHDGGLNWTTTVPPGASYCTVPPAAANSAINPMVAFGADGTAYMTAYLPSHWGVNEIIVNTSRDGGSTWSLPTIIDESHSADRVLDWAWVVTDPSRPQTAYVSWMSGTFDPITSTLESFDMMLSKTVDAGRSWSSPKVISQGPPMTLHAPSRIVFLPNDTMLNVFFELPACSMPCTFPPGPLLASHSTDGGESWSEPVEITKASLSIGYYDAEIGRLSSVQANPPTVAPDGTVTYMWPEVAQNRSTRVYLTTSPDGIEWTTPRVVMTSDAPLGNINLAAASDGSLGVLFYDYRNDVTGDDEITADVWFARSTDGGDTWNETHVAGPFDLGTLLWDDQGTNDIGSHQGFASVPGGFVSAFTLAGAFAERGPSDIYFARIETPDLLARALHPPRGP